MAEVTMPSDYILDLSDLAGQDLHSWRLREAPHMDAKEIGVFYHGDRINAVRDLGWLKLTDGSGFVKESHGGHLVWKLAQSSRPRVASTPATTPTSCAKKEFSAASDEKSVSSASGSQSSALVMLQSYSPPTPYSGTGYTLDHPKQWFTGKSFKIGPAEPEDKCDYEGSDNSASASAKISPMADRQRWADMEDTDDEEPTSSTDMLANLDPAPCLAAEDCRKDGESSLSQELDEIEVSTVASTPRASQAVRNPKRKQRNQALLRRRCKTQLCQHLTEKGTCPFGNECWFAHSEHELQTPDSAEIVDSCLPNVPDEKPLSEEVSSPEEAVGKPCRRRRNQALLQKKSKTEFCRYLQDQGCCPFEGKCWFAHDLQEIRA
eukprot:TRINITY_DN5291_c0_g1_i1.p1 TRINITY_DN5291_c0_g1~~TRINITY_DN5291_c0_g1_i1.p1  ORF type:complete len:377 (-),score=76.54 TRINITY_DN5291_c0_g1_i1:123-1253(-)